MPELQNYNIGTNFLAGMERGRQMGRERQLGSAAGEAFNATPDQQRAILARVAATDPQGAFELQNRLNADQDRQRTQLYNMARSLKTVYRPDNPAPAAALYQSQLAPGLRRMGFEVPEAFDPSVMEVADQVLGAYAPAGMGNVQSTQRLANGNIGIVTRSGQVIDTGQAAEQSTQLVNQEGAAPFLAVTRGPGVGSTIAVGPQGAGAAPMAAPTVSGPALGQAAATTANIAGLSPEQNATIARVSQAMRDAGLPDDQVDAWVGQQVSAAQSATAPSAPTPMASGPVPMRNPTAAETARATQDAKNASDLAAYTAMTDAAAQRERATTLAGEAAKAESARANAATSVVSNAEKAIPLIEEVLTVLPKATGSRLGVARDEAARIFGETTEGAAAASKLDTIAPQLVGMVPRFEGPQSDADRRLYEAAAGDLNNRNKTIGERQAAAEQMLSLHRKAIQNRGRAPQSPPAGNRIRYDAQGNRL